MQFLLATQGAIAQGLLWAILALGTYITFRLLNFADMTVDGSFATGAAVTAALIAGGVPPFAAMLAAFVAGAIAGGVTGLLHTKLGIPDILSGILTQLALYSVNLRILGRANQPLLKFPTLFKQCAKGLERLGLPLSADQVGIVIGLLAGAIFVALLYWFFGTEIGASIRATGNNEAMVRALGQNTDHTKLLGLLLSNALIGASGSLVAMYQGAADVGMGAGAIVIGLASIVIGEVLFARVRSFWARMLSIVVGSVLYRFVVAMVLQLGLNTNDMKLFTAALVVVALAFPTLTKVRRKNPSRSQ